MARYDPQLIAALAAGELPRAEAVALEREIASDPRAAAELAAQRLALEALHRSPTPVLSAEERAELRRAVSSALNLEEGTLGNVVSRRRRVPWRPIAVAAAALAVIAAAVPLIGLLSIGGDQAALSTIADADLLARTPADATPESLTGAPGGEEAQTDQANLGAEMSVAEAPAAARQALEELLADPAPLIAAADPTLTTCAAEAGAVLPDGGAPAAAILGREGGDLIAWFVSTDGATLQHLALFDPADCRLLAMNP